ncbi:putative membrane protein [Catenibacillus scindens]|uniref:Putative membrane protein n=1 Tax=Catenibacillus scindens TaxID=673271 RepID=A0A7W8H946_9FIRM|nr:hypothetical protein [Catenibacillus scindens]MBB5263983.1 putative membrane protein [Catenibacillus scindens]
MKILKRVLPMTLASLLVLNSAIPAFAADTSGVAPSEKEEVIYITLDASGTLKNTYVVNSFSGGSITDYGNYASVKMLNTSDPIEQNGDTITFSTSASKAYYQGELTDAEIPWNISLRYYLDGVEYSAAEIAGKSGELEIRFQITENTACSDTFFDDYALQASFTLDTERCNNISAPDATIANVGSDKQLTYTVLPGEGIDTTITADVTDFEMSAVSINGIHLNLNVEIDDTELKDKVNELIDAVEQLDDSAVELSDGSAELLDGSSELKDGASSLQSGVASLDEGVVTLQNGLTTVQSGLDTLNSQSGTLTAGSSEFKAALVTIQTAVNSISVTSEDLTALTEASGQIKQAISDLYDGAAALQANLGYGQYKALMAQNGLDIDALLAGNASAVETIQSYEAMLEQLSTVPGMEDLVNQYKSQLLGTSEQIKSLLNANSAAIGGMESYLNGISAELPALTEGLAALNTQYEIFDSSISQLVNTLGNMTGNLSALAEGINQLVVSYEELDSGINDYTGGVAQIVAGYSQVMGGVSSLAEGSKELVSGSGELYDGTVELYDGVVSLCDGAQEMADGTGEFRTETADMNDQIDEEIDSLLESIGGSMDDPVSFVSEKNTNVESVQFVIQTEAIEVEETDDVVVTQEEELSFWQKLLQLFGLE